MEDVNKIEIKGKVVSVELKSFENGLKGNITVVTNYLYSSKGEPKVEKTFHSVSAWRSKSITCLSQLEKGQFIRVVGRYHRVDWTDEVTGELKRRWEIVADTMRIIS